MKQPFHKTKLCFCYKLETQAGSYYGISNQPHKRLIQHLFSGRFKGHWHFELLMWDIDPVLVAAAEIECIVNGKKSGQVILNNSVGGEFPWRTKKQKLEVKRMQKEAKEELKNL